MPIQRAHEAITVLEKISKIATQKDAVAWMIEDKIIHGQQGLMA